MVPVRHLPRDGRDLMTIGGDVFLACDGEEEWGTKWPGPGFGRWQCSMVSKGTDIGFSGDPSATAATELEEAVGWKAVTREGKKTLHFCPGCSAFREHALSVGDLDRC